MEGVDTDNIEEQATEKKRGFWLSGFLVLMFVANSLTSFIYITNPDAIASLYPKASNEVLYFLAFLAVVNVILAAGVWVWKKWGVYGFYVSIVIAFAVNIYMGLGFYGSLAGLFGGVIIYFTTKKRWKHFT